MIRTLDSVDSAVIQLSSMIIVKFRGSVMCRVMSERGIEILGDHAELLKSPGELFDILSRMIDRDTGE